MIFQVKKDSQQEEEGAKIDFIHWELIGSCKVSVPFQSFLLFCWIAHLLKQEMAALVTSGKI